MANQSEVQEVSPETAIQAIIASRKCGRPLMFWGPPGSAKSALVKQAAIRLGINFIDLRLVQIDAVDLRGLPKVRMRGEHEVSDFIPPGWLPTDGEGILFLDELPQAPTIVLNSASELLLDRRSGDYILPDGWSMVAAGNRRSDRAATGEIPSHLKNRLIHMEMAITLADWMKWASKHGINSHILSFLDSAPRHLHAYSDPSNKAQDKLAVPTLRTWEFASDILNLNPPPQKDVLKAMLVGCLGRAVAFELMAHMESSKGLPDYKDIIADPLNAPIPTLENDAFKVLLMVSKKAKLKDAGAIATYFARSEQTRDHIRPQISRMLFDNPEFGKDPTFAALAKDHKEL